MMAATESRPGSERVTAAHANTLFSYSVMKSTRARPPGFSPEGEEAHMDGPHRSEGRLFCLDVLRETASVSGNQLLWTTVAESGHQKRSGSESFLQKCTSGRWPSVKICKMTSSFHMFISLKKKRIKIIIEMIRRHMREFGTRHVV